MNRRSGDRGIVLPRGSPTAGLLWRRTVRDACRIRKPASRVNGPAAGGSLPRDRIIGDRGAVILNPGRPSAEKYASCACQCSGKAGKDTATPSAADAEPDLTKLTAAQKVTYHRARWDRNLVGDWTMPR